MASFLDLLPFAVAGLIGWRAWRGDGIRGLFALLVPLGLFLGMVAEDDAVLDVGENIVSSIGMGLALGGVVGVCLYRKPKALPAATR